jgi:colanic acid/amylovoran biosynthesis glycosyltransferase
MRLVLFVDKFPVLSETFIVNKCLGLLKRGWDVHVVCQKTADPANWDQFPELTAMPGIRQRVHDGFHSIVEINDCLYTLDPELIHFEFGSFAVGRMYLKEMVNCKVLVYFRGFDINHFGLDQPACYQEVWERADALLLRSQDLWRRAQLRGCPPDKRHYCLLPGLDTADFDTDGREHSQVAGSLSRPLHLLSIGRLVWKKGYEFGLQAVRSLRDQGIECEYRIIGAGEYEQAIRTTCYQLGLQDVVHFLGGVPQDRVKQELMWADVLLHPAVSEGFCLAALEAQAMQVPVVCSDAGGLPENVADGLTGFVVPRRNPQALARKVARLAQEPTLRQSMGLAGRQRVLSHFRLDGYLDAYERIYDEVSGGTL